MATTAQVIDFLKSKGSQGAAYSEIQRFVVEANGRDYDVRDSEGRRLYRGYWSNSLSGSSTYGKTGLLAEYCVKVGKNYVLKNAPAQALAAVASLVSTPTQKLMTIKVS